MPTYEYACTSCGEHLEVVQSFRDDALTTCPACQGPLRKVFGSIGVVFKGSGFYKNDSRSAGAIGSFKESDSSSGDSKSSSGDSKSDTSTKTETSTTSSTTKETSKDSKAAATST